MSNCMLLLLEQLKAQFLFFMFTCVAFSQCGQLQNSSKCKNLVDKENWGLTSLTFSFLHFLLHLCISMTHLNFSLIHQDGKIVSFLLKCWQISWCQLQFEFRVKAIKTENTCLPSFLTVWNLSYTGSLILQYCLKFCEL